MALETDKRIVHGEDSIFLRLFWIFGFSSKPHVEQARQERKPHKHFNHFMWNSLPYQFRTVDGDVMKGNGGGEVENLFELVMMGCLRYVFKLDGKAISSEVENISKQWRT